MPRANEAAPTQAEVEERRLKAMKLRLRGKSYSYIGKELGVSAVQAYNDVMHEVRLRAAELKESSDDVRSFEVERLDVILDKLWDRIDVPGDGVANLDYVETFMKVANRRAKLLGLDAAGKSEVTINDRRPEHTPDAELYERVKALQERLARLPGSKPHPMLLERNPFEVQKDGSIVGEVVKVVGPAEHFLDTKSSASRQESVENGQEGGPGAPKDAPDGGWSHVGELSEVDEGLRPQLEAPAGDTAAKLVDKDPDGM